jgi:FkbM family methyltransferase
MISGLRKLASKGISSFMVAVSKTRMGAYALDVAMNTVLSRERSTTHNGTKLTFCIPNRLNQYRIESFSLKEPETLDWIDNIPGDSVLWDIGANVGLYSCYAAKSRGCRVYAFEPSVFNLALLAKNIFINDLVEKVVILPLPLSNSLKLSTLNMTSTELGGALSTFGDAFGDDGKELDGIFSYSTIGLSLEQVVNLLRIPPPTHMKIDVDGLEHLILAGGEMVLNQLVELAIEVNEDFSDQLLNTATLCERSGLVFREKRHSPMFDKDERFGRTYNQFWYRPKDLGIKQTISQ